MTTNHHDIRSSKRTMKNNFNQLIDNNITKKIHHSSKSKPESGSDDIYTTPLNNEGIKITSPSIPQKQRTRQKEIGDYINEDADEESTAIHTIMTKTKTPIERIHRLSIPSNLQQQGIGDHHHHSNKNRNKTTEKYHQENIYRWRLFMYILTIIILVFIIYRFLLTIWPKPKKTLMKQFIDNLLNFFTP